MVKDASQKDANIKKYLTCLCTFKLHDKVNTVVIPFFLNVGTPYWCIYHHLFKITTI